MRPSSARPSATPAVATIDEAAGTRDSLVCPPVLASSVSPTSASPSATPAVTVVDEDRGTRKGVLHPQVLRRLQNSPRPAASVI